MRLPPQGEGTVRALSRIGYDLREALADLIDNSIDAGANRVEVTFYRNDHEITAVGIADDGIGMDAETLMTGMQFAGQTSHAPRRLGTYGMGMKTASFSQCRRMSVITRRDGCTSASRWNRATIGKEWECELLDPVASAQVFDELCLKGRAPKSGTLVLWEQLDRMSVGKGADALDEFLSTAMPRLDAWLGLTFHRFLQRGDLTIATIVRHERRSLAMPRNVVAHDPFDYPNSGEPGWPRSFNCDLPDIGTVELQAHVWPAGSTSGNFLLGSRKGVEFQGFYFYRNDRLVQAGGWNGVVKSNSDPALSLARVAVELPPGGTDVTVQKSALQVTAAQAQALADAGDGSLDLLDYLDVARAVYRADRRPEPLNGEDVLVPGSGMPWRARSAAEKRLARGKDSEDIDFVWQRLEHGRVFDLDLTNRQIILNREYRPIILADSPATGADAPFVKMLLFVLFKDDFHQRRSSRKRRERVDLCNALLFDIVRAK
jgi:hypothetical protein